MPNYKEKDLISMANTIRFLSIDAVEKAQSGHPGMPMGMADVATLLFSKFLKFYPVEPEWPNRDRFVLSAGHGSMLLYSLLYLTGYKSIDINQIKKFRQLGSRAAGHPEYDLAQGIEATTGPLGQGFANAVGMAIAERILNQRFGEEIVDHRTYVVAGDGCLMEGITHEAASLAGHLQLNRLIVLFDSNQISIDGPTNLAISDDYELRFRSYGWNFYSADGHNFKSIEEALTKACHSDKPSFICCNTIIGKGSSSKAGSAAAHGAPLGAEEIATTRKNLGWNHDPFFVPEDIMQKWNAIGLRNKQKFVDWETRLEANDSKNEFMQVINGALPDDLSLHLQNLKKDMSPDSTQDSSLRNEPTRKSSGRVIAKLAEHLPELIGGSADLTGSNSTKAPSMQPISSKDFAGQYIHYGIREHAMAAIMNGMSLHGGIIPYGGSFLVFSDYMRPAIRLSALMRQRVIYVMTHDSIGLGEDGPTHQPVEHLPSLRTIPDLYVFRPADGVEVVECWQKAIELNCPSVLVLTRQNVDNIRLNHADSNLSARGFYILQEAMGKIQVTIFASGSEIGIALQAREMLLQDNIGTRVISTPCWELFDEQSSTYQQNLLENNSLKVAVEASLRFGWEKYIGKDGIFIGMKSFGASAPAKDLYNYFKITPEYIYRQVLDRII